MVETLRIYVLGSPILQIEERPLTADLISLKGQALLVYLAVTGQPHSRSALAGLLWGDLPEASARANLRLTLTRLRKFLPETILHTSRLEIGLENFWLDATEFEQTLQANSAFIHDSQFTIPNSPFQLYRDDFLTGFDLPNAPEFETWAVGVRERLRQTAVTHLYRLVETAVHSQQATPGIQAARQLLAIEPWHEETHRQLMTLLAADGQRSAALTQYETCRRLLEEELGVQPSSETQSLYQLLLNDKVTRWQGDKTPLSHPLTPSPLHPAMSSSHTLSPPHNLPPHFTPFIGRAAELERLCTRLQDGRYRLVTLVGEGGVGKTRLALAAAGQLVAQFSDGVWFVPLADVETSPETELETAVAIAIAAALGLNFANTDPPQQQLANYLRRRQALLILDNFELLLAAAGLTLALLTHAPQVTILVTSREPLQLQAEMIMRLDGLGLPAEDNWETAVTADSVRLFAERVEQATGRDWLTQENLAIIAGLCRLVNGLPLAIELIAGWTRWLSLSAIATELKTNLWQLETTMQDVPLRHRSLQAVFTYSWQMLSDAEQQTLAQLSIFRGSFQLDAVTTVTHSAPATLFSLISKSLVQHTSADRYGLHELLRVFARSQLTALSVDMDALRDRHAAYFLERISRRAAAFFAGPDSLSALRETQAEAENLARAWQWACERPLPDNLLAAINGMSAYWHHAGLFQEGDSALAAAVGCVQKLVEDSLASTTYSRLLAALSAEHAAMLYELTRLDEMKAAAEAAIQWSLRAGDEEWEANGRLRRGQYYWRCSSYEEAEAELVQAARLAQKLELTYLEGVIYRTLAVTAWRQGNLAQAQQHGERSLALHQQADNVRSLLRSQHFLAILAHNRQQHAAARAYLEPMLDVAQAVGDRPLETSAVALLAQVHSYEGRFEQALDCFERERQLAEESGQQWQLASNLGNTGDLWLRLGQFTLAAACYEQALALFRQLGTAQGQSNVLAYMGLLAAMQGEYENGRTRCQEALELAQAENAPREIAFAHTFLGYNLFELGEWPGALEAYKTAAAAWARLADLSRQLEAVAGQVRVLLALHKTTAAKTAAAALFTHLQTHNLSGANDPVRVYLTCCELLADEDSAQAEYWLRQGKTWLDQRAAAITDPVHRENFLNNIPSHRVLRQQVDKTL